MARVTVEDCVDKVPNRFDLVMLAAHRAREISAGGVITVDRDNDKNPVVALREIADETQASVWWNPTRPKSKLMSRKKIRWHCLWAQRPISPPKKKCRKKSCFALSWKLRIKPDVQKGRTP